MTALPLLLDAEQLHAHLNDPDLIIIDLSSEENYRRGHIPGAINGDPKGLLRGEGPIPNKLPTEAKLSEFLSSLGVTDHSQLVIYDDQMGPWAGRMIWTLDILGHQKASVLDGQLAAWIMAGYGLETTDQAATTSDYQAKIRHPELIADVDYILAQLNNPHVRIWDARSEEEYAGEKLINCQKGGHIPGAHSFNWLRTMRSSEDYRIKPSADLIAELQAADLSKDSEIITHCQTHRRSGLTYLVAKSLGYQQLRCYDGSWFEWGNHPETPVEKTS